MIAEEVIQVIDGALEDETVFVNVFAEGKY